LITIELVRFQLADLKVIGVFLYGLKTTGIMSYCYVVILIKNK